MTNVSITNQSNNVSPNSMNNIQTNALSTLAALATSSDLITSPVSSPSPHLKPNMDNVNGNAKQSTSLAHQDSSATKARVSSIS